MRLSAADHVTMLVRQLYAVVAEFERHFPGRKFTPDGHLVGSIGEVLAAHYYGLTLLGASAATHDAVAPDGRNVQVKATQGKSVALRSEPAHLLVLHLTPDGRVTEVFNGPGSLAWQNCGRMQSNGQCPISLPRLRKLMEGVGEDHRLAHRVGTVGGNGHGF